MRSRAAPPGRVTVPPPVTRPCNRTAATPDSRPEQHQAHAKTHAEGSLALAKRLHASTRAAGTSPNILTHGNHARLPELWRTQPRQQATPPTASLRTLTADHAHAPVTAANYGAQPQTRHVCEQNTE